MNRVTSVSIRMITSKRSKARASKLLSAQLRTTALATNKLRTSAKKSANFLVHELHLFLFFLHQLIFGALNLCLSTLTSSFWKIKRTSVWVTPLLMVVNDPLISLFFGRKELVVKVYTLAHSGSISGISAGTRLISILLIKALPSLRDFFFIGKIVSNSV